MTKYTNFHDMSWSNILKGPFSDITHENVQPDAKDQYRPLLLASDWTRAVFCLGPSGTSI